MRFIPNLNALMLAAAATAALAQNAFAYLDPGTGSFVFQALAAALLGAIFAVKTYWEKIAACLRGIFSGKRAP